MPENSVLMDVKEGVATITLNRPDVHNAFDEHMIAALSGKFDILRIEEGVHAVVLRGAGKSFSAGADINWMKRAAGYSEDQNRNDALALAVMLNKLYDLPQATIACVHGAAMGGGMGLVSCCDIVLSARDAVFALSEVKLGLIPATIAPYVLRAIGERQARRYFQTAERIDSVTAWRIELVHEVVPQDDGMEKSLNEILGALAANGPRAMRDAKRLCRDFADAPLTAEAMNDTAARIARVRGGDEAKEGLSAFLAKRKPSWGRPQ